MQVLVAVIVLSILILAHEMGHFFAARKAGMLVEEFGLGLPPRIWGKKKGETLYSINALPFGGFVKIYGENGPEDKDEEDQEYKISQAASNRAFYNKPALSRFLVLVAGVATNFFLGVLLFAVLYATGVPTISNDENKATLKNLHVEIVAVAKNSPAALMGLMAGDKVKIARFEKQIFEIKDSEGLQKFVGNFGGKEVVFTIERNNQTIELKGIPRANPPPGEGPLGISLADVGTLKYPWYRSIWEALLTGWGLAQRVITSLGTVFKDLVTRGKVTEGVTGPIGIVSVAGEAARLGFTRLLLFIALITINLAVLNLLPIPALDGGRVLFLIIEKIRGKPVSRKIESTTHAVGMAVLLILIVLISIHDIRRLY